MKELNQTQIQEVAGGAYLNEAGAGTSIAGRTFVGAGVSSMPAELVLDSMSARKGFISGPVIYTITE